MKTLALSSFLVASSSHGIISIAGAGLAPVCSKVPEAGLAELASLSMNTVLTDTLACLLVALSVLAGGRAVAGHAAVPAVEVVVVGLALVTQGPGHSRLAETLPSIVVAPLRPLAIALALHTVLCYD